MENKTGYLIGIIIFVVIILSFNNNSNNGTVKTKRVNSRNYIDKTLIFTEDNKFLIYDTNHNLREIQKNDYVKNSKMKVYLASCLDQNGNLIPNTNPVAVLKIDGFGNMKVYDSSDLDYDGYVTPYATPNSVIKKDAFGNMKVYDSSDLDYNGYVNPYATPKSIIKRDGY